MPVLTTIAVVAPQRVRSGQVARVTMTLTTSTFLAAELLPGTQYESLTVAPLTAPIAEGDLLMSSVPNQDVIVTATAPAEVGDESVSIAPYTPIQTWPVGTQLSFAVDPGTLELTYYPGKSATVVTVTYTGDPDTPIVKAATGSYLIDLDTTTSSTVKPGTWTGAVTTTGVGQGYQPFSFSVTAAPI